MAKGMVFIPSGAEVQRFLYSGAFDALQSRYDLTYLLLDPDSKYGTKIDRSRLGSSAFKYIPFREDRFEKWVELFNVSCVAYEEKSCSFGIRFRLQMEELKTRKKSALYNVKNHPSLPNFASSIKKYISLRSNERKFSRLRKFAAPAKYSQYRESVLSSLGLNPEIDSFLKSDKPDFIVLASSLLDPISNDVLQIAWTNRITSFLLVSGWDNLSSKGIIFHKPTAIGVWGNQTKMHAIEIQGMPSENVFAIGAPHYEAFRLAPARSKSEFKKSVGLSVDKKVVLFGGSFRRFDETVFLRQIEEAIEGRTIPPIQVIYRPHPWRLKRQEDDFFKYQWKHVIMDPEIANIYKEAKTKGNYASSNTFLFSMEYLNELYRAIDAAISPMSTLILEVMIFGKPVLAAAFNDGKHLWSADQTSQMSHFRELRSLDGITFCRSSEEFIPGLKRLILASDDVEMGKNLRKSSRFFVFQSDSSRYSERLCKLVQDRLQAVRWHSQ